MLKGRDGGALAVYAPTHIMGITPANNIGLSILQGIFPKKEIEFPFGGYSYHNANSLTTTLRLGDIIAYGMAVLRSQSITSTYQEVFSKCNLFGDPSMIYHTNTPTNFKNAEVYRYDDKIKVVAGEHGIISLYNPYSGEQYTYEGVQYIQQVNSDSNDFQITISGQNKIPFILLPKENDVLTFQNTTIRWENTPLIL